MDSESTDLWEDNDLAGWDQLQGQTSFENIDEGGEPGSAVEPLEEEVMSDNSTAPANNTIEYSAEEIKQIAKYKILFPKKTDEEIFKDLPGLLKLS